MGQFCDRIIRGCGAMALTGGLVGGTVVAVSFSEPASAATTGVTVAGGNGGGFGANQLMMPFDVAVDSSGNVYVADTNNSRVQEWARGATSGVTVAGIGGEGPDVDQLSFPQGVAVDSSGDVYVADTDNNRVQKWALDATVGVTVAGGSVGGSAAGQLLNPGGDAVDSSGNVYVVDTYNNRVQKWAPGATSGVTVAGGNGIGSNANQLAGPDGVALDRSGDVYVTDTFNDRVQEWAPGATSGITVAGGNGQGSAADQLSFPGGLAFDSSGNLYVTDSGNDRVQEFAAVAPADDDLAIDQPANITVNANGPSGASVTYAAPTVTDGDDTTPPVPSCLPVSGSTFAVGTTKVTCSVSDADDTNGTQMTSFDVNVVGTATQLADLLRSVTGVGPGTSFYDKLVQAQDDLAANDTTDFCGVLGAFIHEVQATQSQSAAAPLVASANGIGVFFGCWTVSTGAPSKKPIPGPGHSAK
jgi:sugar lactone lactonase YvrE